MAPKSYDQLCPIASTLDLVGERWTLLIARELLVAPLRFGELEARLAGISPTLLTTRLRSLVDAGLIEQPDGRDRRYALTSRGEELEAVLLSMARFGLRSLGPPTTERPLLERLVPDAIRAMVVDEELPDHALVISLRLGDVGDHVLRIAPAGQRGTRLRSHERLRVVAGTTQAADVELRCDLSVLLLLRRGELAVGAAWRDGLLDVDGQAADRLTAGRLFGVELRERTTTAT